MLKGTPFLSFVQACLPLHDQKLQLYVGHMERILPQQSQRPLHVHLNEMCSPVWETGTPLEEVRQSSNLGAQKPKP